MRTSLPLKLTAYAFILLLMVLYLFPILLLFNVSLKSLDDYLMSPMDIVKTFHFQNYVEAWNKGQFSKYIWNSVYYTSVSTIMTILISIFAAYPVSRKYVKFSGFIYVFFVASQFLPNPLVGQLQFMVGSHLYNTQIGYILLRTSGTGVIFMMFVGYVSSISRELDESAGIEGSGYIRYIFQFVLPLMKPIVATGVILSAIGTWNDLVNPLIYLHKEFFPITAGLMEFKGQYGNNWPLLASGVAIVIAPLIVLYIFIQKYIVDGALAGAVKS